MTAASSTCGSGAYPRSPSPGEISPDPDSHGQMLDSKTMFHISDVNNSPMKKNKRKRSEPRKRTDFSIKRFCPDSPGGGSAGSESGRSSEDVQEDPPDTPDRSNTSSEQDVSLQGPSDSNNITPPVVPHGMFLFPGHFPPNYLIPNLHYKHPAFLPNGTAYGRMDLINSASIQRDSQQQQHHQTPQQQLHHHHEHHNEMEDNNEYDEDDYMNDGDKNGKKTRKNYKNMTRERRVEANARERTRVHTISAAFDSLRRAVPSYSYNQKLSKLAILRIASSYINALGSLADHDYSSSGGGAGSSSTASSPSDSDMSFSELVDVCTRTIQTEGRARRRH
ncbi:uncharacterized protein LOC110448597 [Mizuhopecten yessoensis]|uniref:Protein atonal-like 8 n=1 Tax=Mizuhopecten yessoensis TaxID=6573 RepID=A0A210QSW7_MIZYE|nr:uncharacterized protein LOC110448597 [Mizuhopecten yessoensis]OWF51843.1 Protein atonal-like 8 [Mizuhopecten yessoensis]